MSGDYTPLKTDRRQWNKSDYGFMDFEQPDVQQNDAAKRYEDHLFNLHINNQVNKMITKKDKRQMELEKLEGGFSLFTNGAHQTKEKYTPRHTTASKSTANSKKSYHFTPRVNKTQNNPLLRYLEQEEQREQNNSDKTSTRKKWSNSSFTLKTTDGCQIKINGPNRYDKPSIKIKKNDNHMFSNDYYSDDFESESDDERDGKDKHLIESVQFSDFSESDSDEVKESKSNQGLIFNISKNDVKFLRDSLSSETSFSLIRESLLVKKETTEEADSNLQTIDEDLNVDDSTEASSVCDMIIKKAVNLKKEERDNLVNFLKNIDHSK